MNKTSYLFCVCILSLLLAGCGPGQALVPTSTPIPTAAEPTPVPPTATPLPSGVTLYYDEVAQVELIAPGGTRVLIDVLNPSRLSSPPTEKDILLTTHTHDDHLYPGLEKTFPGQQLFVKAGEIQLPEVTLRGIPAAHSDGDPLLPEGGSDYIFIVDMGGLRIAHFGDIGQLALTEEQMKALGQVDVAITQFENSFSQMDLVNKKGFALMQQLQPRLILQTHSSLAAMRYAASLWPLLYSDQPYVALAADSLPQKTSLLLMGRLARSNIKKLPDAVPVDW